MCGLVCGSFVVPLGVNSRGAVEGLGEEAEGLGRGRSRWKGEEEIKLVERRWEGREKKNRERKGGEQMEWR